MKDISNKLYFFLFLSILTFANEGNNQENPIYKSCKIYDLKLDFRHSAGSGIGYNKGYTTLDLFYFPRVQKIAPFVDLRLHMFNDGRFASNIGLGVRSLVSSKYLFGVNNFFDYRSYKKLDSYQYGFGIEFLAKSFEFYANGYIPFGKKRLDYSRIFDHFEGRELIVSQKRRASLAHFDLLARYRMYKQYSSHITPGIGCYYLFRRGNSDRRLGTAFGIKGEIKTQLLKYITIGFDVSYDKIFKTRYQGSFGLTFPLSIKKRKGSKCKTRFSNCILQRSVQRDEIIPLENKKLKYPLINPITAEPYQFIFVNNLSGSNGTFEDPFSTIDEALDSIVAHNIIYVFPGDGSAYGQVIFDDYLRLQGSADSFKLQDVVVPALTSNRPFIDAVSGFGIISLQNFDSVNGFIIGDGMIGTDGIKGTNIENFMVSNCNIAITSTSQAIDIQGFKGKLVIKNCTVNSGFALPSSGFSIILINGDTLIDIQNNISPRGIQIGGSTIFDVCTRFKGNNTLPSRYILNNMTVESPDGTQAGLEAINQANTPTFTNVTFTTRSCF
jgi:Inverse autotransporter, beta-domain